MDPDAIRKFGLPYVTIADTTTTVTEDFKVTGAIEIISPTNHPDTVIPTMIMTDSPTFVWNKYPSSKEYIIKVTDSHGDIIWGGFDDSSGVILHDQIGAGVTSTVFNFDGSASDSLHLGETYRWKIYADNDETANIQGLISASEDLLGIFKVVADTIYIYNY